MSQCLQDLYTLTSEPTVSSYLPLGPTARAIAVNGDNSRVYVTRFISGYAQGTVWRVNTANNNVKEIEIQHVTTPDGNNNGPGTPNYLAGIAISPFGEYAVVVGKKDNTFRGELFGLQGGTHESTVRAMGAVIDLHEKVTPPSEDTFD